MLSETCPKCPEFVRNFVIQFSLIFGSEMHSAGMVKIGKKLSQGDIDTPSPQGGGEGWGPRAGINTFLFPDERLGRAI